MLSRWTDLWAAGAPLLLLLLLLLCSVIGCTSPGEAGVRKEALERLNGSSGPTTIVDRELFELHGLSKVYNYRFSRFDVQDKDKPKRPLESGAAAWYYYCAVSGAADYVTQDDEEGTLQFKGGLAYLVWREPRRDDWLKTNVLSRDVKVTIDGNNYRRTEVSRSHNSGVREAYQAAFE